MMAPDPRPLEAEILTETTLDQFMMAGDMTAMGSVIRTLVYEIRRGRVSETALRGDTDATITAGDDPRFDAAWEWALKNLPREWIVRKHHVFGILRAALGAAGSSE